MTTTPKTETTTDAVIREVRRTKENLARQHGFDVRRIAAAARAKQGQSGHPVVSRSK
jgi:hypothetical protein